MTVAGATIVYTEPNVRHEYGPTVLKNDGGSYDKNAGAGDCTLGAAARSFTPEPCRNRAPTYFVIS